MRKHTTKISAYKDDYVEGEEEVSHQLCLPCFIFILIVTVMALPWRHEIGCVLHPGTAPGGNTGCDRVGNIIMGVKCSSVVDTGTNSSKYTETSTFLCL